MKLEDIVPGQIDFPDMKNQNRSERIPSLHII